jgi:Domain of unknown function (DUF2017)
VSATFHTVEVELLRSLVGQLLELVHDAQPSEPDADDPLAAALALGDDPDRPTDPVLLRLFPDAYADEEQAAEFRRYTERGLREAKSGAAAVVLASLATPEPGRKGAPDKLDVRLDGEQATAWLRTLTDLRLALGTRLGVEEGDEGYWDSLDDDDPRAYVHHVYEWLGFVQETLVRALSARLR